MQDVSDLYLLMEETERQAVRRALLEERGRYCSFISLLQPMVVGRLYRHTSTSPCCPHDHFEWKASQPKLEQVHCQMSYYVNYQNVTIPVLQLHFWWDTFSPLQSDSGGGEGCSQNIKLTLSGNLNVPVRVNACNTACVSHSRQFESIVTESDAAILHYVNLSQDVDPMKSISYYTLILYMILHIIH